MLHSSSFSETKQHAVYFSYVILSGALLTLSGVACDHKLSGGSSADVRNNPVPLSSQQKQELKRPLKDPAIVVYKSKRQLELYADGAVVRTYRVGLGFNPVDDKQREGDGCTPEGDFYIFTKNANSSYYLSLGLSYPNTQDAERGLRERLISKSQYDEIVKAIRQRKMPPQYTPLGGLIYIHGNGAQSDWTWGCVALENEDVRELYDSVSVGTPVTIKP